MRRCPCLSWRTPPPQGFQPEPHCGGGQELQEQGPGTPGSRSWGMGHQGTLEREGCLGGSSIPAPPCCPQTASPHTSLSVLEAFTHPMLPAPASSPSLTLAAPQPLFLHRDRTSTCTLQSAPPSFTPQSACCSSLFQGLGLPAKYGSMHPLLPTPHSFPALGSLCSGALYEEHPL